MKKKRRLKCRKCGSTRMWKAGFNPASNGKTQKYVCAKCHTFTVNPIRIKGGK